MELGCLKELYKTCKGRHRAKQETRKALRGAVIQKKDCLCILLTDFRKALIFNRFASFRTGCMPIYRFATEGQLSLFMDSPWSLIMLISSFIGKKYLGYFFVSMLF